MKERLRELETVASAVPIAVSGIVILVRLFLATVVASIPDEFIVVIVVDIVSLCSITKAPASGCTAVSPSINSSSA